VDRVIVNVNDQETIEQDPLQDNTMQLQLRDQPKQFGQHALITYMVLRSKDVEKLEEPTLIT